MEKFKRSTARDFRINTKKVEAIFNEEDEEEEEEEKEQEEENEEEMEEEDEGGSGEGPSCAPPKAKKLKRH